MSPKQQLVSAGGEGERGRGGEGERGRGGEGERGRGGEGGRFILSSGWRVAPSDPSARDDSRGLQGSQLQRRSHKPRIAPSSPS